MRYKPPNKSTTTTLNDIPQGTVFYGDVFVGSTWYSGVWIKLNTTSGRHNVHAVRLTEPDDNPAPIVAVTCSQVQDYRVLNNPQIIEETK